MSSNPVGVLEDIRGQLEAIRDEEVEFGSQAYMLAGELVCRVDALRDLLVTPAADQRFLWFDQGRARAEGGFGGSVDDLGSGDGSP